MANDLIKCDKLNKFMLSSSSVRYTILVNDPDPDYIYSILSKHLSESIDVLKSRYEITLHKIRLRIFISGSYDHIAELFFYLSRYGLSFESISQDNLRIDFNSFLSKIK